MNKVKTCLWILLAICHGEVVSAQTVGEKPSSSLGEDGKKGLLQLHGILRGKYEYQPDLDASRFEVRNARLSAEGNLPLRSSYKLEVDLCDESAIKMKDAWVRVNPWSTLRITLGQQRMPFSIDAHRNPSAQYFANRSFIAKQVGDMRDVANKHFPTDLRLNYEKYWYPYGGTPKESEQDKLVAELMIRF